MLLCFANDFFNIWMKYPSLVLIPCRWWEGLRPTGTPRAMPKGPTKPEKSMTSRQTKISKMVFLFWRFSSSINQLVTETKTQIQESSVQGSRRYQIASATESLKDQEGRNPSSLWRPILNAKNFVRIGTWASEPYEKQPEALKWLR